MSSFNNLFKGKSKPADPEATPTGKELTPATTEIEKPIPGSAQKVSNCLGCTRVVLFLLCCAFSIIMLLSTILLLWYMPYEPIFWVYVFFMVFYWVCSFTLVGLSMKVYMLRNEETGVKVCSKESLLREVKRVEFWVFILSLVFTLMCMFLLLRFTMPESFFPSSDLKLTRVAGVTADSASMWIRNPSLGENAEVRVEYRLNGTNDAFALSTASATLSSETDYSGFVLLGGLTPSTVYEWRFQQVPDESLVFKTNPAVGSPNKFSFYFGSCFLHNFPNLNEAPGFGYVLDNLKPDLFTFLGDFIYSDIPFFRDDTVETYKALYRHALQNSHVERVFKAIPNYHMWDDHEIQNDFPDLRPSNLKRAGRASFENAITNAWSRYLGGGNPSTYAGKTYFNFDYGDCSFFFLDTRVERVSNKLPDAANKTMLGDTQKAILKAWLLAAKTANTKFKFIMSPLGLTSDFPSTIDSWGGYRTERNEIYDFIRDNEIEGVLFFSGDSHFAYAVELGGAPGGIKGGLYEFSASPISAFDFTLGGVFTDPPFVPEADREDRVIFENIGRKGPMSLLGLTRVDTTKAVPEVSVEFYDSTTLLYTVHLNMTQIQPWL